MSSPAPTPELHAGFSAPGARPTRWEDVVGVLASAELFWISTVRTNGRPHVTPLPAVWRDGALYFCTGPGEQKALNLRANDQCVLTTGTNRWKAGLDVVVEGRAEQVTDDEMLRALAAMWKMKYDLAGGHLDLDLTVEQDDELALRCVVPVEVVAGVVLAEDDPGDAVGIGHPPELAAVPELDLDVAEARPAGLGQPHPCDAHRRTVRRAARRRWPRPDAFKGGRRRDGDEPNRQVNVRARRGVRCPPAEDLDCWMTEVRYCPACAGEFHAHVRHCPDCDVPLGSAVPAPSALPESAVSVGADPMVRIELPALSEHKRERLALLARGVGGAMPPGADRWWVPSSKRDAGEQIVRDLLAARAWPVSSPRRRPIAASAVRTDRRRRRADGDALPDDQLGARGASLWPRFLARSIDDIIGGLLAVAVVLVSELRMGPEHGAGGLALAHSLGWFANLLWLAIRVGCEVRWGRTPGKAVLGLRVISRGGTAVTWRQAATRNAWVLAGHLPAVGRPLANVVAAVIAWTVYRRPDHQGVHDRIAGTLVVRDRR